MNDAGRTYEIRLRGMADPDELAGVAKLDVLEAGDLVLEGPDGGCVGLYARGDWISAVVLAEDEDEPDATDERNA
jgi:hypothetical protein